MNKKRKIVLLVGGVIIGLTILFLFNTYITDNYYRKRIPQIPDSSSISLAVEEQISDALKKAQHKPSAKNLGELGMVFHSSTNYHQAAQCYQLAIRRGKSEWKWNYYLGYLNMELGNSNEVIGNFNRVIEINPDVDLAWYYLGEAYRNLRKNDLAEKTFSKITSKNNIPVTNENTREDHFPLGVYARFQLSKIYVETRNMELAEETLKKLLVQNELFGPAYRLLGNIYSMKGDLSLGEKYMERANDLILFFPPVDTLVDKLALMSRSELYLMKRIDEASHNSYSSLSLRLVEQGLKHMPDNKNLVLKAINVYLVNKLDQEAAELAAQHINSFIDNYSDLNVLGYLFFQKGIHAEAVKYWTEALKIKPDNVDIYKNIAISLWRTGEKQKIQEILTEAAEIYQDNPDNLADIVYAFIQFEHMEKANEYLKRLNQQSPQNPKVQKIYGKIAEINGNLTAAITKYESSFTGNPKDTETINSLGNLLAIIQAWDKYLAFYKEVIMHNPNNPDFLNKLGTFYLGCPDKSLRNLDEGLEYSIRAFIHVSSPPHILLSAGKNLAVAYGRKGDKQNAIKTIQRTLNISKATNSPESVTKDLEQLNLIIQQL